MMRTLHLHLLVPLAVSLVGPSLPVAARAQDAEPADKESAEPAEPQPEFKDEKAQARFEKGKELFGSGEYRDAAKEFRSAARGARTRDDRAIIAKWQAAAKNAPRLAIVTKLIERNRNEAAYGQLQALRARFEGTPALALWKEQNKKLEELLFQVIESFDYPKKTYTEEKGHSLVDDPKLVFQGARSLRWKNPKEPGDALLSVRSPLGDWTSFGALDFWVNTTAAVPLEVYIVTDVEKGRKTAALNPGGRSGKAKQAKASFMTPVTLKPRKGWQRIHLGFEQFSPQGPATLEAVKHVQILIRGRRSFDIYVDELRLMKKDDSGKKRRRRR